MSQKRGDFSHFEWTQVTLKIGGSTNVHLRPETFIVPLNPLKITSKLPSNPLQIAEMSQKRGDFSHFDQTQVTLKIGGSTNVQIASEPFYSTSKSPPNPLKIARNVARKGATSATLTRHKLL